MFVRNWWRWKYITGYPNGSRRILEPDPGARKTTLATRCTYEEARQMCARYAETHKPGPLSRKAEFERE